MFREKITASERRRNGLDHHHLIPKSRGGTRSPGNMVAIKPLRHVAWHQLFAGLMLDEIISFLSVRSEKVGWIVSGRRYHTVGDVAWYSLFGTKTLAEAIYLLKRLRQAQLRVQFRQPIPTA